MTKNEYIKRLKEKLFHLPIDQVDDILYDYEEHFQIGIENGKTEEEIAVELGKPEMIAAQYRYSQVLEDLDAPAETMESRFQRKYGKMFQADMENGKNEQPKTKSEKKPQPFKLIRAMITAIGLGFFNIVFVLGLYLGVVGILIALIISSGAFAIAGVFIIIAGLFPFVQAITSGLLSSVYTSIMLVSGGLSMMAGGTLGILLFQRAVNGLYNWTVRYLRTNLNIIRKAGE